MRAEFGTLVTDYRHIKAGALHRANGGYLLLDARVLLRQPLGWEALKQALRNRARPHRRPGAADGCFGGDDPGPGADPARRQGRAHRRPGDLLRALRLRRAVRKAVQGARGFRRGDGLDVGQRGAHRPLHSRALRGVRAAALRRQRRGQGHRVQRPPGGGSAQAHDALRPRRRCHPGGGVLGRASTAPRADHRDRSRRAARHRRAGLSVQPVRGADARADHRRHDPGGGQRRGGGAGQRPGGAGVGRLRLRPAQPDHLQQLSGPRRGDQHRARGPAQRPHPRQGHA